MSLVLYSLSAWRREYARGGSTAASLARLSTRPVGGIPLLILVLWVLYMVVGVFGKIDEASGGYGGLVNGPLSRGLAALVGRESIVYAFLFGERSGLVSTGLTYAVAIVFPTVTLFFLAFALMEHSGCLPRLAFLAGGAVRGLLAVTGLQIAGPM